MSMYKTDEYYNQLGFYELRKQQYVQKWEIIEIPQEKMHMWYSENSAC